MKNVRIIWSKIKSEVKDQTQFLISFLIFFLISFLLGVAIYLFVISFAKFFTSLENFIKWIICFPVFNINFYLSLKRKRILYKEFIFLICFSIPVLFLIYLFKVDYVLSNHVVNNFSWIELLIVSSFPALYFIPENIKSIRNNNADFIESFNQLMTMFSTCLGLVFGFDYFLFIVLILGLREFEIDIIKCIYAKFRKYLF